MDMVSAALLGLVQGLTEFLPVSSSGHLAIAQHFLPGFEQPGLLFDVLLHTGTTLTVSIFFRKDIWKLLSCFFRKDVYALDDRYSFRMLVLGSIPTAIIGLSFKDFFAGLFENMLVIACLLVGSSVIGYSLFD
jgi:undecaprenyl-diphosphatase